MDEDASVVESPPTSPARSVRARAASPPAAERKEEVDISKHVAMMRARSKENDLEGAMQVFRKLQSSGVQLTSLAYNALLDSCVQCGKVNVALQHFKEMKDLGLVDVVSYNTLLKAYLKQGQIAKARKLLTEMAESDIEACVRVGQLDLLSSKLQQYAGLGGLAGLTAPTYGSMIKAYGRARDIERVRELWNEMRRRHVTPTSITLG